MLIDVSTSQRKFSVDPFNLTYNALSKQLDENNLYCQPLIGQKKRSRFIKLKKGGSTSRSILNSTAVNMPKIMPTSRFDDTDKYTAAEVFGKRNASVNYQSMKSDYHSLIMGANVMQQQTTTTTKNHPCAIINRTSDFVTGFSIASPS